jgi:fucose permease
MALVWFFLLSVPSGILQDKIGKKRMLTIGMLLTGLGMFIPFIHYSFPIMLSAFIVLGIGNTIVQVSANPLLHDVSPREKYASYMSLSQFIKAIISLLGPIIATLMATKFGNWKLVFTVYSVTSFLSVLWLSLTPIEETQSAHGAATFKSCFSLLKKPFILVLALGIFMIVGADVGMNSNIANFLQNQFGLTLERASLGISLYFSALMIGRFSGAVILNWISPRRFLLVTAIVALVSLVVMLLASSVLMVQIAIFMVGLGSANLFPLIFSIAVEKMPGRSNEISGLMIMAISGGAVIPPMMGIVSTHLGVKASFLLLVLAMVYILGVAIYAVKK